MKEKLKNVPQKPGVYLFKDAAGTILYVGKAKILRQRMRSYFQANGQMAPKVKALMNRAVDFDFIVTGSELEALLLENNLIKAHQPKYNIMLRDDKTYPHLKVSVAEKFPRVSIVRGEKDRSSRYFGPYTDVGVLRETLRILSSVFQLRTCKNMQKQTRACLKRDIGKCLAPCCGFVTVEEYRQAVKSLLSFLEGNGQALIQEKEVAMKAAAQAMQYEKAARLRDEISALNRIRVKQQVSLQKDHDIDLIALSQGRSNHLVLLFKIRAGNIVAKDTIWLTGPMAEDISEFMSSFIQQYYDQKEDLPQEILVNRLPEDLALLTQWLKEKAGHKVELKVPQRGEKKQLLEMVQANGDMLIEEFLKDSNKNEQLLSQLSKLLALEVVPERMECYDVSHLSGQETVASMVVFQDAAASRSAYRRFKINQDKNDDFAALAETLRRRFEEARRGNEAFLPEPDLIVVDGGVGQLHAVQEQLDSLGVSIPVISLAKKNEIIYYAGDHQLQLSRKDECLQLLQRLRDEAHRFAITYNRKRRQQKTRLSVLDHIPGIGGKRKQALLKQFGSAARVKQASLEELLAAEGIPRPVAESIYKFFHPEH